MFFVCFCSQVFVSGLMHVAHIYGFQNSPNFDIDAYLQFVFSDTANEIDRTTARGTAFMNASYYVRARDERLNNYHYFRYKDMVNNPTKTIRAIADFLEVDLSAQELAEVVRKTSYAYMKANEHKFSLPAVRLASPSPIIRAGKSGNSREQLSAERARFIDETMEKLFYEYAPEFPYREMFLD